MLHAIQIDMRLFVAPAFSSGGDDRKVLASQMPVDPKLSEYVGSADSRDQFLSLLSAGCANSIKHNSQFRRHCFSLFTKKHRQKVRHNFWRRILFRVSHSQHQGECGTTIVVLELDLLLAVIAITRAATATPAKTTPAVHNQIPDPSSQQQPY